MELIHIANNSVYPAQGIMALYGVFCVIVVIQQIRAKSFRNKASAEQFVSNVRDLLNERKFDQIAELCDTPPYWAKAVPQLIIVAIKERLRDPASLRRLLAEKFDREVISEIEYRMSWVNTVVKSAPMLGLLGTVLGMIEAFAKIAGATKGGIEPSMLAKDISFALITTAVGLIIAIPLVLAQSNIHVRLGRLQAGVQQYLGEFLEAFDAARRKDRPR